MTFYIYPPSDFDTWLDGAVIPPEGPTRLDLNDGVLRFNFVSYREEARNYYPSFAARLEIRDGSPVSLPKCFSAVDWGGGIFELYIIPKRLPIPFPEWELCREELHHGRKRYTVSALSDSFSYLSVEADGFSFREALPPDLLDIRLECPSLDRSSYITVSGKLKEQNYLGLYSLSENGVEPLLSLAASGIERDEGKLSVRQSFNDMLKRVRVEKYRLEDGSVKLIDTVFSYGYETPYPLELTPYLFLEAVGAYDTEYLKRIVSHDISESISDVFEYFGPFCSVEFPKYSRKAAGVAALKYKDGDGAKIRYFKFKTERGLISDFEEIE